MGSLDTLLCFKSNSICKLQSLLARVGIAEKFKSLKISFVNSLKSEMKLLAGP